MNTDPRDPVLSCSSRRRTFPARTVSRWIFAAGSMLPAAFLLTPPTARALPSYARQMDMQCIECHTEFPILNQYGRQFKLMGYTLSADQPSDMLPIALMLQPSFTQTQAPQAGGAAPGFGDNNNFAVTQVSLFYAGRLFGPFAAALFGNDGAAFANKFGIFSQTTYDGVAKAWHWDNTELRFADTGTVQDQDLIYGLYANNNPTMQDPWNTTPAWGFPFSGSGLAPGPAAGTLIDGGLSQQVAGVGAYTMVANQYYFDVGGYSNLSARLQKSLGVDPTGETQVTGVAPYWRLAKDTLVGEAHWEVGIFGLSADTYPGRDSSAGKDRITDFGVDSQYQVTHGPHDVTAMVSLIDERENWGASYALGNTSNPSDSLKELKTTLCYLFDKTYGASVQYFLFGGESDPALYSDSQSGSPTSDGFVLQASYLPFNKGGGPPFWPRSNVKISLQYTIFNRFDGARTNYDGQGSNASGNNTLYAEVWIAF